MKALTTLTKFAARTKLKVVKYSPEILLTTGIVAGVGSTILACKATLKLNDILDKAKEDMKNIDEVSAKGFDYYTKEDATKDRLIVTVQTSVKLLKLYGPALALGLFGIGCVVQGHRILNKRNIALVAAYGALDKAFNQYRDRVIEKLGEEEDLYFKNGIKTKSEKILNKDTVKEELVNTKHVQDPSKISVYAKFFDEYSHEWKDNAEYNLMFLKAQQEYCNHLLHSRGHLFLNEVYDMLGIPRTSIGAVVGWVDGMGDNFVDFGIYDVLYDREATRAFINGYEKSILLDFNVDGTIYDKI